MKIKDEISFENGLPCYKIYFKTPFTTPHDITIINKNTNQQLFANKILQFLQSDIDAGISYYFLFSNETKMISINVTCNNNIILEKIINIDFEYLNTPIVLIERPSDGGGLGDNLFTLPTIKKLSKIFNRKIDVITRIPQIFLNNPYIENLHVIEKHETLYDVYKKYNLNYKKNLFELLPNHSNENLNPKAKYLSNFFTVDLRQICAFDCGFHLTPDESNIEFYPDPFIPIDLPEKYVLINPRISGIDRDIGKENWQKIIDNLNDYNINVVTIGLKGTYHDLKINLGKNLCGLECQNNLSQIWHIINKSKCLLTFDTGIYVLAGSTDTQIFLIDTYLNSHWHAPYRNGSNKYKHAVINGKCDEYCLSNLKYYHKSNGIFIQPMVQQCALKYSHFKCIPSAEIISDVIKTYMSN